MLLVFRSPLYFKRFWLSRGRLSDPFSNVISSDFYQIFFADEAKLTDDDISNFVTSLLPIAFHILFNNYDDERKTIFNILATLRPSKTLTIFNILATLRPSKTLTFFNILATLRPSKTLTFMNKKSEYQSKVCLLFRSCVT